MSKCELLDRECVQCGKCDECDLTPGKYCDNCCECIELKADYKSIDIDDIVLFEDEE